MPGSKRRLALRTHVRRAVALACFVASASNTTPAIGRPLLQGAPSFNLFGAFFPGWMFCALLGVTGAILARVAMVGSGLAKILPLQLFVCASIGLIIGLLIWLTWFGR